MAMHVARTFISGACLLALGACQSPLTSLSASSPVAGARLCPAPALPEYAGLKNVSALPDPFTFGDGTRVVDASDWQCRRAELIAQVQKYELGDKPPAPRSVRASAADQQISITVEQDDRSIDFAAKITLPTIGKAPYPAIIGVGGVTLNNDELLRLGVAIIAFPNNDIAEQQSSASRGKGKFYTLYGSAHPASAMTAWSWGISRLIDGLEQTPGAHIDARRLAVTGCSRNGKGAIVAGALDERIALTIAQESGSGGAAGWRVSEAQLARGEKVQTLRQIVQENVWFTESFRQFSETPTRLPFDQHSVMALIAPRALLVVENTSMEWLGNQSAYVNAVAAREVWKALGAPDAMGISQIGGHDHCRLPQSQYAEVNNYVKKFLLGDSTAPTDLQHTDGTFSTDTKAWIDWTTPRLR